jgi:hypothetical protein
MNKKKTRKSKAAKSMRDLPQKTLSAKAARGVKGGGESELNYEKVQFTYSRQRP